MWILLRRWWIHHLLPYPLGSILVKTTIGGVNPPTEHFAWFNQALGDIMVSYKNNDIRKIFNGKRMTGRSVDFKVLVRDDHKFIANRRDGYFAMVDIVDKYVKKIGDLTNQEILMLGYSSIDEYLAEPFNKGLTRDSEKLWIVFDNVRFNMNHPIVQELFDELEADWEADYLDAMVDTYAIY